MEDKIKSFYDLRVWHKGIEVVEEAYKLTAGFPEEERYGLSSQMRRAAISIPSNIAEGFKRRFAREQKQFLSIALGSCAELETQLVIAKELSYLGQDDLLVINEMLNHVCAMLVNMYKRI